VVVSTARHRIRIMLVNGLTVKGRTTFDAQPHFHHDLFCSASNPLLGSLSRERCGGSLQCMKTDRALVSSEARSARRSRTCANLLRLLDERRPTSLLPRGVRDHQLTSGKTKCHQRQNATVEMERNVVDGEAGQGVVVQSFLANERS
jgi:hypothetical protein